MSTPVDPLRELGRRMRALAEELGCEMGEFAIRPDLDGNADIVQVLFVLPDLVPHPEHMDSAMIDAEAEALLADIEAHEAAAARESQDAAAIESLLEVKRRINPTQ